jgi:hypothetical protein
MKQFWQGALSGFITVFLVISIWQTIGLGGKYFGFLLIFSLFGSLILGLVPGGIGGLIGAKRFKNHEKAAYIGGIVVGLIEAPFLSVFASCALMGGC